MKRHPRKAERTVCAKGWGPEGQAGHCSLLSSAWAWGARAMWSGDRQGPGV